MTQEIIELGPQSDSYQTPQADVEFEAPEPEPTEAKSVDDALEAAFKAAEEKAAAKEEKPKADKAEKTAKADKEPTEETEKALEESKKIKEEKAAKERGPDGKFAAKAAEAVEEEQAPEPKPSAFKEPPARFDKAAKDEWEAVPESVRGAVHRATRDLEAGLEKYRAEAKEFESIREFDKLAKESGTNLRTALENYTGMERMLRSNPIQGLEHIVQNLGLRDSQGNPITFRQIAHHVAGMPADQVAAQHDATSAQLRTQVQQLQQQLQQVTGYVQEQKEAQILDSLDREWKSFVSENPVAAKLEGEITELLQEYPNKGKMLKEYLGDILSIAKARRPDVAHTDANQTIALQQAQTLTPPAPRQTNPAGQKSLSGAPTSNATIGGKKGKVPSLEEALERAIRRAV